MRGPIWEKQVWLFSLLSMCTFSAGPCWPRWKCHDISVSSLEYNPKVSCHDITDIFFFNPFCMRIAVTRFKVHLLWFYTTGLCNKMQAVVMLRCWGWVKELHSLRKTLLRRLVRQRLLLYLLQDDARWMGTSGVLMTAIFASFSLLLYRIQWLDCRKTQVGNTTWNRKGVWGKAWLDIYISTMCSIREQILFSSV